MKKIELKSRKLLRTIFGCISFTAVAFAFQACYGTFDRFYDIKLTGTVKSKTTNLPIEGIKITVNDGYDDGIHYNYGLTDKNGKFAFYASVPNVEFWAHSVYNDSIVHYIPDSVRVQFIDIDDIKNGYFENQTVIINPAHKDEVKINVELETKQ